MKIVSIITLLFVSVAFAQFPDPNKGNLAGGFGLSYIDGNVHYAFRFTPEISFMKFGVGLDLNLELDSKGKLRKENFNDASDYLSIIRYIRYGQKKDKLFVKAGAIDMYTLGHGSIMYMYNNSTSIDNRKIGLVVDADFDKFGFESIYSDFSQAGVAGLRAYVKPLQFTSASSIPIVSNLELGATIVGDMHKEAGIISGYYDNVTNKFVALVNDNSVFIYGFDLGLPLLSTSILNAQLYFDYAKIADFGDGATSGINLDLNGMGLITASVKFERRWNNDKFIPAYFNSLYEVERFRFNQSTGLVESKLRTLKAQVITENGYFGGLKINVANLFEISGSYQRLDKNPDSGILQLYTEIAPKDMSFLARAGYDKTNINEEKAIFKLDDRSYLFAELGYKPYPYLLVSMVYNWTFTPVRDGSDKIISFAPQKKIEPRITFIYPFNVGK